MKVDFEQKTNQTNNVLSGLDIRKAEEENTDIVAVSKNEVEAYTQNYKAELRERPEVQAIVDQLDVTDMKAILEFGQKPAEAISSVSDKILTNTKLVKQEEVGEVMVHLTKIMSQFDMKDFEEEKSGFLQNMFKKVRKTIDELIAKYDTMGGEVEQVYLELKKYENAIMNMADKQKELGEANIQYYQQLEQYIVAGEMALDELNNKYIPEFEARAVASNDNLDQQRLTMLMEARDMLNSRVYDLQLAENIAFQTISMIQQIQRSNFLLLRTIKSEFIVTLPVFKQGITQAIMLKRQALIAKNVEAVRATTDELIVKNAQNTATQSAMIANMATRGAVSMDKLREAYEILKQGSEQTTQIIKNNLAQMDQDRKLLEQAKYEMVHNKK